MIACQEVLNKSNFLNPSVEDYIKRGNNVSNFLNPSAEDYMAGNDNVSTFLNPSVDNYMGGGCNASKVALTFGRFFPFSSRMFGNLSMQGNILYIYIYKY